jgi:hypothetical protein
MEARYNGSGDIVIRSKYLVNAGSVRSVAGCKIKGEASSASGGFTKLGPIQTSAIERKTREVTFEGIIEGGASASKYRLVVYYTMTGNDRPPSYPPVWEFSVASLTSDFQGIHLTH